MSGIYFVSLHIRQIETCDEWRLVLPQFLMVQESCNPDTEVFSLLSSPFSTHCSQPKKEIDRLKRSLSIV